MEDSEIVSNAQEGIAATGRRKEAVARVRLVPGKGVFLINGLKIDEYLKRPTLIDHAVEPLGITESRNHFDITCTASGGGNAGQAGAIRLAVSRALVRANAEHHNALRQAGMLTRDARRVERKKYGRPKARKRFQYSKR